MFSLIITKLNLFNFACALPHKTFFFLPSWWEYLSGKQDAFGSCIPNVDLVSHPSNLWLIGLAILDILIRVGGNGSALPHTAANQGAINSILNAAFVIFGALAVLFIILAGFRMVTSGDNPTKVAEARRQILFAALGLVVIATAGTLVNFVLNRLG
jgi:hypothetical protein